MRARRAARDVDRGELVEQREQLLRRLLEPAGGARAAAARLLVLLVLLRLDLLGARAPARRLEAREFAFANDTCETSVTCLR